MISRLDRLQGRDIYENTALAKLNEVIDAVNNIVSVQEKLIDSRFVVDIDKTNPISKPIDPYTEQRKWIGKLCKFWDDNGAVYYATLAAIDKSSPCPYCSAGDWWWEHCSLVKPGDDIIFKGE